MGKIARNFAHLTINTENIFINTENIFGKRNNLARNPSILLHLCKPRTSHVTRGGEGATNSRKGTAKR